MIQPLKSVIRMATPEDEATEKANRQKEKEAFRDLPGKDQKTRAADEAHRRGIHI